MKLLREPLLHFLVIGAGLFGLFQLVGSGDEPAPDEIVVSTGQIASLEAVFSRTWQRPPTAKETEALVEEYIRDEVLYREGVAMGLDRDDTIVRRRIRQKMEFLADLAADADPSDAELKAFIASNPERFRAEPRFSFSHVFLGALGTAPDPAQMSRLLASLNHGTTDATKVGSPLMVGSDFQDLGRSIVAQTFGEDFAASLEDAASGVWQGPVTSAYGLHLVRLSARVEARDLPFAQVSDAARREFLHARKVEADKALYETLKSRYVIKIADGQSQNGVQRLAEAVP